MPAKTTSVEFLPTSQLSKAQSHSQGSKQVTTLITLVRNRVTEKLSLIFPDAEVGVRHGCLQSVTKPVDWACGERK